MYGGWYQVAYERELTEELTGVRVDGRRLLLVARPEGVEAYDAVCPHRGADLAVGGRLDGDVVVCPFHARRIALGGGNGEYCVRRHRTAGYGGLVLCLLDERHENGLEALFDSLVDDHYFVPGFELRANVRADLVIENAFDNTHFHPVHGVLNEPDFEIRRGDAGELSAEGTFVVPVSAWQRGSGDHVAVPFVARAFSPNLVVSHMGGDNPYWVITGATPDGDGGCVIRTSLVVPAGPGGEAPPAELCRYLLQQSRAGIEQDVPIWENLVADAVPRLAPEDGAIVEFRKFCRRFELDAA